MVCGFCGTSINPGFNTCTSCGAIYKKVLGCFGTLIALAAVVVLSFSFAATAVCVMIKGFAGIALLLGVPLMGASGFILWLTLKTARYKWVPKAVRISS